MGIISLFHHPLILSYTPKGGDDSQGPKPGWDEMGEGTAKNSGLTSVLMAFYSPVFDALRLHFSSGTKSG